MEAEIKWSADWDARDFILQVLPLSGKREPSSTAV